MSRHEFTVLGDMNACMVCGGRWDCDDNVTTPCSGDTRMLHGDPHEAGHAFDCEVFRMDDTCPHVEHSCDCYLCQ